MTVRPTPEQVLSLAPDRATAAAASSLADPASWSAAGCDQGAVWGNYIAVSAEPYMVAIDLSDDLVGPAYRCSCPSRKVPCKHALGLLLLLASGGVVQAQRLPFAAEWLRRRQHDTPSDADRPSRGAATPSPRANPGATPAGQPKRQFERSERMRAGLQELDRWVTDQVRVGLSTPELALVDTWDHVAARLIDAQCGGLANRVKRVASKVAQRTRWHEDILEELALLHVLAVGAQRTSSLPAELSDGVHVATGLTSSRDDVLAGVPSTARWIVAGESRTREDRITVQRTWLCNAPEADYPNTDYPNTDQLAQRCTTWAMLLNFGAFGTPAASPFPIGAAVHADVHWYPGGIALRALVGRQHSDTDPDGPRPAASTIADALETCGWSIAAEPWLERFPMCINAVPAPVGGGRWVLADRTGSVPIVSPFSSLAELVCVSGATPITVMGEWSVDGFLPLTLWGPNGVVQL